MRTTLLLSQIVDEWLAESDVRPASREDYRKKIQLWFRYLSSRKVDPRTPIRRHVLDYKEQLQRMSRSVFTVNSYITVIKLFYCWCAKKKYYDDISTGIKSSQTMRYYNKLPLSFEQASRLINSVETVSLKGKRDKLIISLMIFNGLRTCEVSRINIEDVSKREDVPILYIQRKGRIDKREAVVLHPSSVEMFEDYISEREFKMSDPLFISHRYIDRFRINRLTKHSIARMIKQRLSNIGIYDKKVSAHSLRHTFGSLMVENGVELEVIKDMMGHGNSNTTRIYVEMARQRKLLHHSPVIELGNMLLKNS